MVRDVLEDQFSLEARLPRTLLSLLFRPGRLTREYAAGRVARYIAPFRLYLVSSLLFFLVLSYVADFDLLWRAIGPEVEQATQSPPPAGGTAAGTETPPQEFAIVRTGIDTAQTTGWLKPVARHYVRQEAKVNAMQPREGIRVVYGATISNVPPVVFLLVPLFALFLKGLYRRRLYIEHFVFVLHFHAFAFVLATIALIVQAQWLVITFVVWLLAYLYAAMKRAYGESLGRTTVKYVVLLSGYFAALSFTVFVVWIVTMLTV